MARRGRLPEYVPEMIRDWISGECAASGRQRSALVAVVEQLLRHGGNPLGQAKLAREAGLANNTVAAGFVELLADLMCVGVAWEWDASRRVRLRRKPAKFPFINLLAAVAWHPARPRSIDDLEALPAASRGAFLEWLAAQEVWRRAAIRGGEFPEQLAWWRSQDHEIDFVLDDGDFLEVKAGQTSPLEFAWFSHRFPRGRLTVLTTTPFETERVRGLTMEQFLREA
jgi:predicted AAA+ superfamily ATPase